MHVCVHRRGVTGDGGEIRLVAVHVRLGARRRDDHLAGGNDEHERTVLPGRSRCHHVMPGVDLDQTRERTSGEGGGSGWFTPPHAVSIVVMSGCVASEGRSPWSDDAAMPTIARTSLS